MGGVISLSFSCHLRPRLAEYEGLGVREALYTDAVDFFENVTFLHARYGMVCRPFRYHLT